MFSESLSTEEFICPCDKCFSIIYSAWQVYNQYLLLCLQAIYDFKIIYIAID